MPTALDISSAIVSLCGGAGGILAISLAGFAVLAFLSYFSYANYGKSKLPAWLLGTLVFGAAALASACWGINNYLVAAASCG